MSGLLFLLFSDCLIFPFARIIEPDADEERREACESIAQPEAVMLHIHDQTEQNCKTDSHYDAVKDCRCKVHFMVA